MQPDTIAPAPREAIALAAWQVIETHGVAAATLRTIAREMGATTGLLTSYFASKEALLCFAVRSAGELLSDAVERSADPHSGLAQVRSALDAVLPHDTQRRTAWAVWVAALGLVQGSSELAAAHAEFPAALRRRLVHGLRGAQREGVLAAWSYPASEADLLLAQTIGLMVQSVGMRGGHPPEKLQAVLGAAVARICAPA